MIVVACHVPDRYQLIILNFLYRLLATMAQIDLQRLPVG